MFLEMLGLFLASFMVYPDVTGSVCLSTAVYDTDGTCFWRSNVRVRWIDAFNACLTMGARLVHVDSQEKSNFIYNHLARNNWMALNDQANESYYVYPDGTLAGINQTPSSGGYLNWNNGVGNPNGGSQQQCVMADGTGKWQDKRCTETYHYICEVAAGTVPDSTVGMRQAFFGLLDKNHLTDTDNLMEEIPVTDKLECPFRCLQFVTCKGYYLYTPPDSTDKLCRLVYYIRGATGTQISTEMWVKGLRP